jgi:hypothetical protein
MAGASFSTATSLPRIPVSLVWIGLAAAIAYSFWGTLKPDCQDMDFGAYYRAGAAVNRGESPYLVDEHGPLGSFAYAPAYAYLFLPLSQLEYLWACRVWMAANWALTVLGCWLAWRLLNDKEPISWPALALAVAACGAYLWSNLRMGQAAMLMVVGCLGWAWCRRRGRPFTGGLALAGACALKLAPALLLPYLLLRRDGRGLAGVVAGSLGLFLLPAAWVGGEGTVELHRQWLHHTAATQIPAQTCRRGNQSLLAQLARLPAISDGDECIAPANLELLSRWYPALILALGIGIYGWVYRYLRRAEGSPRLPACENLVLAVLLIFLTLAHPRAWRCNLVALLFPCLLLAYQVRRRGFRRALAALVLLFLAGAWPTRDLGTKGWSPLNWMLLGKHFWAALVLGITSVSLRDKLGAAAGARVSSAWYAPGSTHDIPPSE